MKTFFTLFFGLLELLAGLCGMLIFTIFEVWVVIGVGDLLIHKYQLPIIGYLFMLFGVIVLIISWVRFFTGGLISKVKDFLIYFFN